MARPTPSVLHPHVISNRLKHLAEAVHALVKQNISGGDGSIKYDAFQRAAATESYVCLTVCKRASPEIDLYFVKSLSLAFVNRDRPREAERILGKRSHHLLLNAIGFLVVVVSDVLPGFGFDL